MKRFFSLPNHEKYLITLLILSIFSILTSLYLDISNFEKIKYYENDKIPINLNNVVKKLGYFDGANLYLAKLNGDSILFQSYYKLDNSTTMYYVNRLNLIKSNCDIRSDEFIKSLSYESDKLISSLFFLLGYFAFAICIISYFIMKYKCYDFDIMRNSKVNLLIILFLLIFIFSLVLF